MRSYSDRQVFALASFNTQYALWHSIISESSAMATLTICEERRAKVRPWAVTDGAMSNSSLVLFWHLDHHCQTWHQKQHKKSMRFFSVCKGETKKVSNLINLAAGRTLFIRWLHLSSLFSIPKVKLKNAWPIQDLLGAAVSQQQEPPWRQRHHDNGHARV